MKILVLKRDRQGSVLINTVFIVLLLVMASFAFMRWAADESHQAEYELARTQAYYVAQYGLFDRALTKLRQTRPSLLPQAIEYYPSGEMIHDGKLIGDYTVPSMSRESDYTAGVFGSRYYYQMQSMGTVMLNSNNPNSDEWKSVSRSVSMRARLKTFSAYLYLTDEEQTAFDEIIWFYGMDTLLGPVHSNAAIGIKGRPMFYDDVTTTASDFIRGTGYNPWFHPDHPPKFNQPRVDFPWQAETLRANATRITNSNGRWQTRMEATEGGFYYEQWELGVPYDNNVFIFNTGTVPYGNEVGIFVEGRLELFGDDVTGQATVGSSGDMFLIDDIRYVDYSQADASADEGRYTPPFPEDYPHKLGLIGEQNIFIANTFANGGGNGLYTRGNRHDGAHIVICAAIVALDERFAFRDQNDQGDDYCWCPPCPIGINGHDERGTIYIRGTVAQRRRGYVHRGTCGGTGYEKDYLFDPRMVSPPPYFLEAVDDSVALFDIVWWQEEKPKSERTTNR